MVTSVLYNIEENDLEILQLYHMSNDSRENTECTLYAQTDIVPPQACPNQCTVPHLTPSHGNTNVHY